MRNPTKTLITTLTFAALLAGCGGEEPAISSDAAVSEAAAPAAAATVDLLVARMSAVSDSQVTGVSLLTTDGSRLILAAALDGVPAGRHAIHVHETGDCSAADGSSAGGHFDTKDRPHGGPNADLASRHAGDFGNFEATSFEQGKFSISRESDTPLSAFEGKAVIVHAGADDLTSQPSGAAGARIACGVLVATAK